MKCVICKRSIGKNENRSYYLANGRRRFGCSDCVTSGEFYAWVYKKYAAEFIERANELLSELGAECTGENVYALETRLGRLRLLVTVNRLEGPGTVFSRFDDAKRAHGSTDCNPHSGKWNHHYFDGWTTDAAIADLAVRLRGVL